MRPEQGDTYKMQEIFSLLSLFSFSGQFFILYSLKSQSRGMLQNRY